MIERFNGGVIIKCRYRTMVGVAGVLAGFIAFGIMVGLGHVFLVTFPRELARSEAMVIVANKRYDDIAWAQELKKDLAVQRSLLAELYQARYGGAVKPKPMGIGGE